MTDMNMEMTLDETLGVEAVAYLNGTVGHTEPKWVTLKNWRTFTDEERTFTMEIYHRYKELEEQNASRIADLHRDAGNDLPNSGNSPVSDTPSGDIPDNLPVGETGGSDTSDNHQTNDGAVDSAVAVG